MTILFVSDSTDLSRYHLRIIEWRFMNGAFTIAYTEFDAWYAENFLPPEPTADSSAPTSPDLKVETLPKLPSAPIVSDKDLQFLWK